MSTDVKTHRLRHFPKFSENCIVVASPGTPGEVRQAWFVSFSTSNTTSEIKYIADDINVAMALSRRREGWYGGTGSQSLGEGEIICVEPDRFSPCYPMARSDVDSIEDARAKSEHERVKRIALAKLSSEERAALGL